MPTPRKPQTDAAEALIALAPLATRWIERLLAAHDPPLTVQQYVALRAIGGQAPTAAELARRTGVSGPAVSQLLAGLADAGMLNREPNPEDRRHNTLTLTPSGERVYGSAHSVLRSGLAELLGPLPPPEADALSRLLPHAEAALAGTAPPRRPPPRRPPHPKAPPPRPRP